MEQLVNGEDVSALTPYNAFYQLSDPCIVRATAPLLAAAPDPPDVLLSRVLVFDRFACGKISAWITEVSGGVLSPTEHGSA